jgi:hypothetical protein
VVPENLISDIFHYVEVNGGISRGCSTDVDGLSAFSNTTKTECSAAIYDPVRCLVLQGAREAYIGGRMLRNGAGIHLLSAMQSPLSLQLSKPLRNSPMSHLLCV